MLILGCFLVFVAVMVLGIGLNKESSGVALHDEWTETPKNTLKATRRKNLIKGFVISIAVAYIVTGQIILTIIAGLIGAFVVANWITTAAIKKKKDIFGEQYTQVLNSIISSLQGGANPYQALEETITSLKNPARDIFIEIIRKNRTGTNYAEAIRIAADETGWEDLHQLEMAFRLYDRTGSNLVEVCSHLLKSAYDRRADNKYVSATTSSVRTTTIVLSIVPFVIMAFMRFAAPEFAYPLFHTTGGITCLCIIVLMIAIGNRIAKKMTNDLIGE